MKIKQLFSKMLGSKPEQSPRTSKENRYFRIHDWMLKLSLTGYETMVFAFIHSYTAQNKGYCYRAEVLGGHVFGTSAETMNNIIKSLIGKGMLTIDNKGLYWTIKK